MTTFSKKWHSHVDAIFTIFVLQLKNIDNEEICSVTTGYDPFISS